MKLSEIRGWSLEETLEKVDADEAAMWEEYWFQELENPDRLTYYLMGVMAECRRPHVKDPNSVQIEQMRIKFRDKRHKERSPLTHQQRTEMAKQMWFAGLGGPPGSEPRLKKKEIMVRKIRPNQ